MQRNYYALVAGLPDIFPEDKKTAYTSVLLRDMLREEVHPADFRAVEWLFLPFDHQNLLHLLFNKKRDWDERGNLSREQMELLADKKTYEMADQDIVPGYFPSFLSRFHGEEVIDEYYRAEMILLEGYYAFLADSGNSFLEQVSGYRLAIGNIMVALNGRKYGVPFDNDLVGEDEVAVALKRSRTRDFGLSSEVSGMEELIQIFEMESLSDRELKLDMHLWDFLEEITFFNYFTIEKVLAFILKLFIVERWMALDAQRGEEMYVKLLKDLEAGFRFPEEFTVAYGKKK